MGSVLFQVIFVILLRKQQILCVSNNNKKCVFAVRLRSRQPLCDLRDRCEFHGLIMTLKEPGKQDNMRCLFNNKTRIFRLTKTEYLT